MSALTQLERMQTKDAVLAEWQTFINFAIAEHGRAGVYCFICCIADILHAEFPQYRHRWNDWKVCRCTHRLTLKHHRIAAEIGDYCICDPQQRTVFCVRTGGDVALWYEKLPCNEVVNEFRWHFELVKPQTGKE